MHSSNTPAKIQLPFASSGTKNTIPVPSQQGITPGAASFTDGFPPLTFTPLSAGGVPPAGADFNGIFNALSAIQQWQSAGGFFKYDATFSTAIGGYPQGAVLLNSSGTGLWICTTENNTTNPDAAGAGWLAFSPSSIQSGINSVAPDTGTANAYAIALSPAPAALTPGMIVGVSNIKASNTGAATLNVNALGALPIIGPSGAALQGYELGGGYGALLRLNRTGTAWELIYTSGGPMPVSNALFSGQAMNLGQFQSMRGMIAYTSTGSITVPAGVTTFYVSGVAGGGGGGGGAASQITGSYVGANGGGGGAGQSTFRKAIAVTPGNVIPVTIGAGGSAGAAGTTGGATGGDGGAGGTTSLGALLTLAGGGGGSGATSSASVGLGGHGGAGYPAGSVGCNVADGAIATGPSGAGASSPFGGGGGAVRASTFPAAGDAGGAGGGYGSGGAGGAGQVSSSQSYAGGPGGAGAPGLLIIEW